MKKIYAVNTNRYIIDGTGEKEHTYTKDSFTLHSTEELAMNKVKEMKNSMWKFAREEDYGESEPFIISEADEKRVNVFFTKNVDDSLIGGWIHYRRDESKSFEIFPNDRLEIRGCSYMEFDLRVDVTITEHELDK